jgi:hypothetical protein
MYVHPGLEISMLFQLRDHPGAWTASATLRPLSAVPSKLPLSIWKTNATSHTPPVGRDVVRSLLRVEERTPDAAIAILEVIPREVYH